MLNCNVSETWMLWNHEHSPVDRFLDEYGEAGQLWTLLWDRSAQAVSVDKRKTEAE